MVTGLVPVAAGESHVCAQLARGAIACWGDNAAGDCGNGSGWSLGSHDRATPVVVVAP
jgi:hypothetical protein